MAARWTTTPPTAQGVEMNGHREGEGESEEEPRFKQLADGGAFLFDIPAHPEPVWGNGSEILWSQGEPCIITGPIGSGKTTVLGRLVHASLGLSNTVLGYTVTPADHVLYLACDRPRQISRNLRRMFNEADRKVIADRLTVWQGPPPADLAKNPGILCALAEQAGATRVFVDGVKDVAAKISEEETGQGLNAEFQRLVLAGVDVAANHHQRKGEGGKSARRPKSLDDVYGSLWLTGGAGTVLLVWADEAGSQSVTLSTLKPAADVVGPLEVVHDTDMGTLEVDAVQGAAQNITIKNVTRVLQDKAHTTLTGADIAVTLGHYEPTKTQVNRARQQANRLVEQGKVQLTEFSPAGHGGYIEHHFKWVGE